MSHVCDGRDLSCASCATVARRLDTVRAAMTVDDDLDDVKRVRIWTRLEDRLSEVGPARGSRAPIAIGLAAAAAVAAAGLFIALRPRDDHRTLSVPVDTVVTSQLGPHTFASVTGPAQLDIVGVPGEATTIHLRSGRLLVDFAGGAGRALRIEAPRATNDVVGTLFAVAVHDGATCTSVSHGRVRITMPAGVLYVVGGQRYCTGDTIAAIETDVREALSRHEVGHHPPPAIAVDTEARNGRPRAPDTAPRAPDTAPRAPDTAPRAPDTAPRAPAPAPRAPAPAPRAPDTAPRAVQADASPPSPPATRAGSSQRAIAVPGAVERPAVPMGSYRPAPAAPQFGRREQADAVPHGQSLEPTPAAPVAEPAAPAPQPRRSPEELYRAAEAALAAHDLAAADLALAQIVDDHPTSPLVDQALYERARIAYQQRAWAAARSHLARLAIVPATPLGEQGSYLRCRVAVEAHEPSAAACLAGFRAAYRSSPHDLDALALQIQLAHARSGCAGAASLVEELAERYPRTTVAAAWRTRCPESP
jgi:TolA-binding protein